MKRIFIVYFSLLLTCSLFVIMPSKVNASYNSDDNLNYLNYIYFYQRHIDYTIDTKGVLASRQKVKIYNRDTKGSFFATTKHIKKDYIYTVKQKVKTQKHTYYRISKSNYIVASKSVKYSSNKKFYAYHVKQIKTKEAAKAITAEAKSFSSNKIGQAYYVYEYIYNNVTYDDEYKAPYFNNQEASSALVDHLSVCAGIARAYALVLKYLDIPTKEIEVQNEELSHLWIGIKIDKKWYHVDPTWGRQDNFMKTDTEFQKTHTTDWKKIGATTKLDVYEKYHILELMDKHYFYDFTKNASSITINRYTFGNSKPNSQITIPLDARSSIPNDVNVILSYNRDLLQKEVTDDWQEKSLFFTNNAIYLPLYVIRGYTYDYDDSAIDKYTTSEARLYKMDFNSHEASIVYKKAFTIPQDCWSKYDNYPDFIDVFENYKTMIKYGKETVIK